MLRISKGKETFALKGDHLETNFQGFYQKSLHWRPRSPMETSVHNPVNIFYKLITKYNITGMLKPNIVKMHGKIRLFI